MHGTPSLPCSPRPTPCRVLGSSYGGMLLHDTAPAPDVRSPPPGGTGELKSGCGGAAHCSHGPQAEPPAALFDDLELPALDSLLQDPEQCHDGMDFSLWTSPDGSSNDAATAMPSPASSSGAVFGPADPRASARSGQLPGSSQNAGSPPLSDSESGPGTGRGSTAGGVSDRARSPDAATSPEHSSGSAAATDTRASFRGSPVRSDGESLSLSHRGAGRIGSVPMAWDAAASGPAGVPAVMVPVGSGSLGPQQAPLPLSRQPSAATSTGLPGTAGPGSNAAGRGAQHECGDTTQQAADQARSGVSAGGKEAGVQSSRSRKRPQHDELERRCQDLTIANTHLTGTDPGHIDAITYGIRAGGRIKMQPVMARVDARAIWHVLARGNVVRSS